MGLPFFDVSASRPGMDLAVRSLFFGSVYRWSPVAGHSANNLVNNVAASTVALFPVAFCWQWFPSKSGSKPPVAPTKLSSCLSGSSVSTQAFVSAYSDPSNFLSRRSSFFKYQPMSATEYSWTNLKIERQKARRMGSVQIFAFKSSQNLNWPG